MPTTAQIKVTLLELYYEAFLRSLQPTFWLPLTDEGSIAKNAAYTDAPGAELLTNGDFTSDGTGWTETLNGGTITYPNDQVSINAAPSAITQLHQAVCVAGNTYRFGANIESIAIPGNGVMGPGTTAAALITLVVGANESDRIAEDTLARFRYAGGAGGSSMVINSTSVKLVGQLDAANTAATVGQAGKLGTAHAYDFDGATSLLTVTNSATLANMTTQKWGFLAKADTVGEGSVGRLFAWDDAGAGDHHIRLTSTNAMQCLIYTSGITANATTQANEILDCLTNWAWYFMDYDDADSLGNGRKIRIFKGLNGTVTPLALATDIAATGTITNQTGNLIIGNNSLAAQTFDGLMDEVLVKSGSLWTTAEMQTLVNLTGV